MCSDLVMCFLSTWLATECVTLWCRECSPLLHSLIYANSVSLNLKTLHIILMISHLLVISRCMKFLVLPFSGQMYRSVSDTWQLRDSLYVHVYVCCVWGLVSGVMWSKRRKLGKLSMVGGWKKEENIMFTS